VFALGRLIEIVAPSRSTLIFRTSLYAAISGSSKDLCAIHLHHDTPE
jgi:hypothetical protein